MLIIRDLKEGNIKNITLDRFDEVNKWTYI
jgi:hypothetical protein